MRFSHPANPDYKAAVKAALGTIEPLAQEFGSTDAGHRQGAVFLLNAYDDDDVRRLVTAVVHKVPGVDFEWVEAEPKTS